MRSWPLPLTVAAVTALLVPATADAARKQKRREIMQEIAPWASEPDRVRLEIVERLVLEKKQYAAALPLIAAMRKEGLNEPILDLLQGIAMREEGLTSEAENMLLGARKRTPGDARIHEALCVLYADEQRTEEAIGACEKATKVDRERPSAWNNLGFLYLVADRPLEALDAMRQAVELDGAQPRYRNNLALAHVSAGQSDHALSIFRSTGTEADALYNVGTAVERFKGPGNAVTWYRRAVDANGDHQPALQAIERITAPDSQENPE